MKRSMYALAIVLALWAPTAFAQSAATAPAPARTATTLDTDRTPGRSSGGGFRGGAAAILE